MTPYPYDPPAPIHALMGVVATAAFGSNFVKRNSGGNEG